MLAVLLLVLGVVACGGGDDSDSTTTQAAQQGANGGESSGNGQNQGAGKQQGSGGGKSGAGNEPSGEFEPKQYDDSGGGAGQFESEGGDNSIPEFGREASGSEFEQAATALHNFLDARAVGDWGAACGFMAKSVVEGLEKLAAQSQQVKAKGCAAILRKLSTSAAAELTRPEANSADVGSVRVKGKTGFVIYRDDEGNALAIAIAKDGGTWKIAGLAGTPVN